MSSMSSYLIVIPGLPLLAAVLTGLLGPRWLRSRSHLPCILAAAGSCIVSLFVLREAAGEHFGLRGVTDPGGAALQYCYTWIQAGLATADDQVLIQFSLHADALTAIMLTAITLIGTLIATYSAGYMHGQQGYPRYFAVFSLFLFSMTGLVLADNFLVLYLFWEGVGLCSYLLIGFWFHKPSASAAARKAFLVTRIGDLGLFIGILVLWTITPAHSLSYAAVFNSIRNHEAGLITAVCILIFCGAVGKSAQFPLHVWLPDAMEGPTPVSALIHAATMVTAGVYLVARCTPLFILSPTAQLVVACVGAVTALLAALIALTQNDLKRVLAYSTVSQLGYMFLALGSATLQAEPGDAARSVILVGVVAAIFHLFTHAFFKALLFLAAGSVMHAMGDVIDMRRFSGLRKILPVTHATFLCGAAALAGVPLLSGFWSKDEILSAVFSAAGQGRPYHLVYFGLFWVAVVTAGLTAFYTFRAYIMTFLGEERIPPEAGHHAHESPAIMTIPLIVLAVGALAVGFIQAPPLTHALGEFLIPAGHTGHGPDAAHGPNYLLMLAGIAAALVGIGTAFTMYLWKPGSARRLAEMFPAAYQLSLNKFGIDEIYTYFIVRPLQGLAEVSRVFDLYVIDNLVDLVGQMPRLIGLVFRPVQNGLTQFYALAMALGVAVVLAAMTLRLLW